MAVTVNTADEVPEGKVPVIVRDDASSEAQEGIDPVSCIVAE